MIVLLGMVDVVVFDLLTCVVFVFDFSFVTVVDSWVGLILFFCLTVPLRTSSQS